MGWHHEIVGSPERLPSLLEDLEPPSREREREQFDAAKAIVDSLAATVSKREPMLVTISGHSDPSSEGFDARNVSVTISRIDPDEAKHRVEEKRREAELAAAGVEAAKEAAELAEAAAKRAEEEAGSPPSDG